MSDQVKIRRPLAQNYGKTGETAEVPKKAASVDNMMKDVYNILRDQIERIRIKSAHSSLSAEEVSSLRDYTRSLIELSKEEREITKAEEASGDLKNLSDEELIELIKKRQKK